MKDNLKYAAWIESGTIVYVPSYADDFYSEPREKFKVLEIRGHTVKVADAYGETSIKYLKDIAPVEFYRK